MVKTGIKHDDTDALIRIQRKMPAPAFVHPGIDSEYIGIRIAGDCVYDTKGRLWADLGNVGMARLLNLVMGDHTCAPQSALWAQYADKYGFDPTHYIDSPLVIPLPAQPIINGMSSLELIKSFIA